MSSHFYMEKLRQRAKGQGLYLNGTTLQVFYSTTEVSQMVFKILKLAMVESQNTRRLEDKNREFKARLGYIVRLCLKSPTKWGWEQRQADSGCLLAS